MLSRIVLRGKRADGYSKYPDFLVYSRALEYNKISFFHTFKSYNKKIGKTDESLGRKAIGPVKWQPVA